MINSKTFNVVLLLWLLLVIAKNDFKDGCFCRRNSPRPTARCSFARPFLSPLSLVNPSKCRIPLSTRSRPLLEQVRRAQQLEASTTRASERASKRASEAQTQAGRAFASRALFKLHLDCLFLLLACSVRSNHSRGRRRRGGSGWWRRRPGRACWRPRPQLCDHASG
jgi:hypothetical protein